MSIPCTRTSRNHLRSIDCKSRICLRGGISVLQPCSFTPRRLCIWRVQVHLNSKNSHVVHALSHSHMYSSEPREKLDIFIIPPLFPSIVLTSLSFLSSSASFPALSLASLSLFLQASPHMFRLLSPPPPVLPVVPGIIPGAIPSAFPIPFIVLTPQHLRRGEKKVKREGEGEKGGGEERIESWERKRGGEEQGWRERVTVGEMTELGEGEGRTKHGCHQAR